MRDRGHCKMNPEAIDLVDEFYDYSEENLAFLQRKFDNLQVKMKNEIEQKGKEGDVIEEEDEWEDCDSEIGSEDDENEVIKEEKDEKNGEKIEKNEQKLEKKDKKIEKNEEKIEKNEEYVLIRGYWHPLKDKIITSKFIKDNLDINDNDEVVLPGGKILGHKKYSKYYKQNMVEIVKKKSEIVRALAYREMSVINKQNNGTVAKYESVYKTLER